MINELGIELTEKELLKDALHHLSEACCFLFETESPEAHALAFMVDSALKYGQVVYNEDDVLSAAADYSGYEQDVYIKTLREKHNLEVIK